MTDQWHRQFVEIGIAGPRRGERCYEPRTVVFQDDWWWLTECSVSGLAEWAQTAKPGDRFVWKNPLSTATGGGWVCVCVDQWREEGEDDHGT